MGPSWDDSTVDSMFNDAESRAGSERYRGPHTLHGRRYSDIATRRARQLEHGLARRDELQPFVISDNGILSVIDPQETAATAPLNTSLSSGLLNERPPKRKTSARTSESSTKPPTKIGTTLRRTKLPYRDNRDTAKRNSFNEKVMGYPPGCRHHGRAVAERPSENGDRLDQLQNGRDSAEKARGEKRAGRELQAKRSTVFENLTPVEEPTFINTQAAITPSSDAHSDEIGTSRSGGIRQEAICKPLSSTTTLYRKGDAADSPARSFLALQFF